MPVKVVFHFNLFRECYIKADVISIISKANKFHINTIYPEEKPGGFPATQEPRVSCQ